MKLRLLKNLVLVGIIGVFAVSCIDEVDPYVPPTKAEELELLDTYLAQLEESGLDVDRTDPGVYYAIDSVGEGDLAVAVDTCTVNYTGFFISGEVFDPGNSPITLELSEGNIISELGGQVISGWKDGLKAFNKGAKGLLIIPSEYAYGTNGYPNGYGGYAIPPNTTVVFAIEMVEIRKGS